MIRTRQFFRTSTLSGPVVAILFFSVLLSIYSPHFLHTANFINISNQISINIILAVGMTILITSGGIDLSVGANVAFTGVLIALYFRGAETGGNPFVGVLIGLGSGAFIGLVNGLLVTLLKAPPFIATLGTMSVFRGLALVLSGGRPLMGINETFIGYFSGFVGSVPLQFIIALVIVASGFIILNHTRIGRYAKAVGGNERAVRVSGLPVNRFKLILYMLTGCLAAIGGMVLTSMMAVAEPIAGNLYELDAVAVVVMGGTLMQGGKGSIVGTLLGAILLGIVRNGLNIVGVPANYQQLFVGLIIMVSVIASSRRDQ